jgi:hypothetical protein
VDAVLDAPVAADEAVEFCGVCLLGGEAGEVVGGLGREEAVVEVAAFAVDPDDLLGVGEQAGRCGRGSGRSVIDAAVATVRRGVVRGKKTVRGGL